MAKNEFRRLVRLILDRRSAQQMQSESQRALEKGTDPKKPTKNLGAVEGAVGSLTSAAKRLGLTLLAALGARQVVRFVRESVSQLAEFDLALTRSTAIMGDVDDAMRRRMGDTAVEVSKQLNIPAAQLAEGFFFLASAGLDAEASILALPAAAEFAKAGAFDLATAVDLVTDAQSALGLASEDAEQNLINMVAVSDVLVKANTLANATVEQFSQALTREAGSALRTFNKDVEEGVAVLSVFADQGIKGQIAGRGLSRILRIMSSSIEGNKEELEALNLEIADSDRNMLPLADVVENLTVALDGMSDGQRAAALESIGFTAQLQGVLLPLIGTADQIREYEAELRNAGGTTKEVAENQMAAFAEQWGVVMRIIEAARRAFAEQLLPALEPIQQWFMENDAQLEEAAVAWGKLTGQIINLVVPVVIALLEIFTKLRTVVVPILWLLARVIDVALVKPIGNIVRIASRGFQLIGAEAAVMVERFQLWGAKVADFFNRVFRRSRDESRRAVDEARRNLDRMQVAADETRAAMSRVGEAHEGANEALEAQAILYEEILDALDDLDDEEQERIGNAEDLKNEINEEIALLARGHQLRILNSQEIQRAVDLEKALQMELDRGNVSLARRIEILTALERLDPIASGRRAPEVDIVGLDFAMRSQLPTFDGRRMIGQQKNLNQEMINLFNELGEEWVDQNRNMMNAAQSAAAGVSLAWRDALLALKEEGGDLGDVLEAAFRGIAAAALGGLAQYASAKVAENVAAAIQNFAAAKAAAGLAFTFPPAAAAAAQFQAAGKGHLLSAAKWGLLGGAAAAAQTAIGGGGAAARSGGLPSGATDIGGRIADQMGRSGPDVVIFVDGVDPNNPRHQRLLGETQREWSTRVGGTVRTETRGRG